MSVFPNWQNYCVPQKRAATGCIPTGYEMILRAAGVANVNFETFQDDFDLDWNRKYGEPSKNNFHSVAEAIKKKYPHIQFNHVSFPQGQGNKKMEAIEGFLSQKRPVLISLALQPLGHRGWHIMPIVDIDTAELKLLWAVKDSKPQILVIEKKKFIHIHDNYAGGDDIAFLMDT